MAKEIQIVFIYDTKLSKDDDILEHILYFYPTWVSNDQKTSLCGQIIGSLQCMQNLFSKPVVMSLNNGKFVIIQHGTFFIVMGSDKNTSSLVLKLWAKSLLSLIHFFHNDLHFLQTDSKEDLPKKLQGIIKDYLKMLSISEKVLVQKPMLFMPKGFDDIFIQALHILECCKNSKHVLGGMISYHNKLIASQLPFALTQFLQLTDAGILCSAKSFKPSIKLPEEVVLYEVYLSQNEYSKLLKESLKSDIFNKLSDGFPKKHSENVLNPENTSVLFTMKKEQSLLFTTVPEEPFSMYEGNQIPKTKTSRPRFLNLDNTTSKNVSKNKKPRKPINNLIITCNTPFQEVKKIVHFNPLSICHNEETNRRNPTGDSEKFVYKDIKLDLGQNYKTIADPTFPRFKRNGKQISYSYYSESDPGRNLKSKSLEELKGFNHFSPVEDNLSKKDYFIPDKSKLFNLFNNKSKLTTNVSKINFDFNNKKSSNRTRDYNENTRQKCILFRWDKCDISVVMLFKLDVVQNQDSIPFICELSCKNLSKLERKMRYNMEVQKSREKKYKYKFVSQSNSTLWNLSNGDWRELLVFSEEFRTLNITEIAIRSDDAMSYGYYYGPNKLFYNEVTSCSGGLPFPADPMGVLQIKAKRRLEADYGLVLF
ncbi:uncharacterized protein LOC130449572 isoform X1 [Diorhabda sublineata]|uniref:uncharacterized protein LOC130449572 isoform X1 n=3 Tax=Diorhabda sublineata TaxID=1163346 RepID=UPI0024E04E27|nr:uncharacterized protein LOC130449572 isoform X1 [Diorhabda sublineata]